MQKDTCKLLMKGVAFVYNIDIDKQQTISYVPMAYHFI
jgi:hypothetical protein